MPSCPLSRATQSRIQYVWTDEPNTERKWLPKVWLLGVDGPSKFVLILRSFNSLPPRLWITAEPDTEDDFDQKAMQHWREEGSSHLTCLDPVPHATNACLDE